MYKSEFSNKSSIEKGIILIFKEEIGFYLFLLIILFSLPKYKIIFICICGFILALFIKYALNYLYFKVIYNYFGGIFISYEILYILLGYSINLGFYLNILILFLSGLLNIIVCLYFSKGGKIEFILSIIINIIQCQSYLLFFFEFIFYKKFMKMTIGWEILLTKKKEYKNIKECSFNDGNKIISKFEEYKIGKNLFQRL